jgi:hypothetical protein
LRKGGKEDEKKEEKDHITHFMFIASLRSNFTNAKNVPRKRINRESNQYLVTDLFQIDCFDPVSVT